jgi:hypothetical protein
LFDGFLSDFKADVFSQGEQLEADELFAEILPEALAHTAEELHCDYAVILVIVIMSHLNDVLEYEIAPVLIVELVGHRS